MNNEKIIDFMGWRNFAAIGSLLLVLASLGSLFSNGLDMGLDFTGGTELEVRFDQAPEIQSIRRTVAAAGFNNAVVVNFGAETDVLVRLPGEAVASAGEQNRITNALLESLRQKAGSPVTLLSTNYVGPQVGDDLRDQGGVAMIVALLGVMLYVAMRFQFKFSVGAVVALMHDVIITVGLFSLFHWDFDLTVLAAILAVIGYSINDTIVVFDRIRENFRKLRQCSPIEVINVSLTQTLARTVVTGLTTLLVLVALYVFGGETLRGFSLALIIGIVVGTYSSIYIASAIALQMNVCSTDLVKVEKGDDRFDDGLP